VALAFAFLAAYGGVGAQFSSGVNLVEVYAAVADRAGNPVTGLTRDDFTVLDDGRPQTVSAFAEGDFPLSVALAIDRSFSMGPQRLPAAIGAARTLLGELRPGDQAMIVAIGSESEILAPLSTDRRAQLDAVGRLTPWGTTGLHDAIVRSIDAIQAARGRRALVLLSDGSDRYSTATETEALARARRADEMVYPIAMGGARPALFAELAALTGGRSSQPSSPTELDAAVRGIARELHHQYLLGYMPSPPIDAGEARWRSIVVRVARPDIRVRARDGYFTK
jgi:Ca-activated chloride channel family protein